jgi:hypothetical protein
MKGEIGISGKFCGNGVTYRGDGGGLLRGVGRTNGNE